MSARSGGIRHAPSKLKFQLSFALRLSNLGGSFGTRKWFAFAECELIGGETSSRINHTTSDTNQL